MEDNSQQVKFSRLKTVVTLAKDIFALLRDFSLFVAAILLLVFPLTSNSILTDAGFEEGSFAGVKLKRQFFDTDTALRTAEDTIASLQAQNSDLLEALKEAEKRAINAEEKEKIANLLFEGQRTAELVAQAEASVKATLAANEPLIEKARLVKAKDSPPASAFCYQEDKLKEGPQRYSVHCHTTLARCEAARGPNLRTKQSLCTNVDLSTAKWAPLHPGWRGSWYEFRSKPFGSPFPKLP